MQNDILIILNRNISLTTPLFLRNLHEESRNEGTSDVAVVVFIFKGDADEFDLVGFHDATELKADVVGGLEGAEGEEVVVTPLFRIRGRFGGFEGVVNI